MARYDRLSYASLASAQPAAVGHSSAHKKMGCYPQRVTVQTNPSVVNSSRSATIFLDISCTIGRKPSCNRQFHYTAVAVEPLPFRLKSAVVNRIVNPPSCSEVPGFRGGQALDSRRQGGRSRRGDLRYRDAVGHFRGHTACPCQRGRGFASDDLGTARSTDRQFARENSQPHVFVENTLDLRSTLTAAC